MSTQPIRITGAMPISSGSHDIPSLKLELNDAEENLKEWTKDAQDNHDRLVQELAASDAQDSRKVIECSNEVNRIKTLLENQLQFSRNTFEHIDPFHRVFAFESGNLDYTIFKDRRNVDRLVRSYKAMVDQKYARIDPTIAACLGEKISHVAAFICAGWCKMPLESPYWEIEMRKLVGNPQEGPSSLLFDLAPRSHSGWYSPGPEIELNNTGQESSPYYPEIDPDADWYDPNPPINVGQESPPYHPSTPQYPFPRPEPGKQSDPFPTYYPSSPQFSSCLEPRKHNVPSSYTSRNTFIPTPTTLASLNNTNNKRDYDESDDSPSEIMTHCRRGGRNGGRPASTNMEPKKRVAPQDSWNSRSCSGWGIHPHPQASASSIDSTYSTGWGAANPTNQPRHTVAAPSGGWAEMSRIRSTTPSVDNYDFDTRTGPAAAFEDNSMDTAWGQDPQHSKVTPAMSPIRDVPTSPQFNGRTRSPEYVPGGW